MYNVYIWSPKFRLRTFEIRSHEVITDRSLVCSKIFLIRFIRGGSLKKVAVALQKPGLVQKFFGCCIVNLSLSLYITELAKGFLPTSLLTTTN